MQVLFDLAPGMSAYSAGYIEGFHGYRKWARKRNKQA